MATAEHAESTHQPQSFIRRYIFSMDHKIIGIQYFLTGFAWAIVGGLLAMLIRMQLAWPGESWGLLASLFPFWAEGGILKPEFYLALITMHGTIMVFFFVSLALVSGFGNYLIPLQIGARDMAFPFLNMLSYWIIVPASLIMLCSFFVEGGAAASGWTAYPPLSAVQSAIPGSEWGQTLWLLAMALFIASFTMGGLNYVVTVLNLRAPRDPCAHRSGSPGHARYSLRPGQVECWRGRVGGALLALRRLGLGVYLHAFLSDLEGKLGMAQTQSMANPRIYWRIWLVLLLLTLVMVLVDQSSLSRTLLVSVLVAAMLVKALLIAGYFMHLRFEKVALILMVVVGLFVTGVILFTLIAPDGIRILELSPS